MMSNLIEQDEKARLRALSPIESFIVQAPAGSGKTELLTQRYLKLLSGIQRGPQEIIAVTFTRKAAAQMRSRIVQALLDAKTRLTPPTVAHARLTWQLAKAALERCESKNWDIVAYPNQLRILTIDALCSHLTSRMPILSNFGAAPEISQQPGLLYQKAVQGLLNYFNKSTTPQEAYKTLLKQVDNRLELAQNLMINMLAKRDQWLGHITHLKGHQEEMVRVLEQSFMRIIESRLQDVGQAFKEANIGAEFFELIDYLAKNLLDSNPEHAFIHLKDNKVFPEAKVQNLALWYAIKDLFMTQASEYRKSFTIQQGFLPPSKAKNAIEKEERLYYKQSIEAIMVHLSVNECVKSALKALNALPPQRLLLGQQEMILALTQLLPLLTAHLTLQFKESGEVDFIEVMLRALSALGREENPSDLALSLDYQLQHLLVDEFQDTSFAQFHLFEKLVSGWSAQEGKTVFLVGDPMQSIYRFRGAEVGLFLEVQQNGLNDVPLTPLRLTKNFRSTPHIVEWMNSYFQSIFPSIEDRHLGAVAYCPAVSGLPLQSQDKACVYFYAKDKQASNDWVQSVLQLLQEPETKGHSIAILVRARQHLEGILPAFRRLGIPFEAHDLEHLGLKQSVLDLLSLTQALLDFSDKLAWLSILRAPWCGLTLNNLTEIVGDGTQTIWARLQDYAFLSLDFEANTRLQRIVPILEYWLAHRQRHRLSVWVKGVWLALGGASCYEDKATLSDAEVFFELLDSQSEKGDLISLDLFEKKLDTLFAKGAVSSDASNERAPIQLMTIHKAKGLEFDIVIVPGLEKGHHPTQSELLIWYERKHRGGVDLIVAPRKAQHQSTDSLYEHVKQELALKAEFEDARLLYVALTRAKKQIHLFASTCEKAPPKGSFLSHLWPKIQEQRVSLELDPQPLNTSLPELTPSLKRLPSSWKSPIEIPRLELKSAEELIDLNHPQNEYNCDKIVGTFVHKILQLIAELGLAYWDRLDITSALASWKIALMRLGVKPFDMNEALNTVTRSVEQVLKNPMARRIFEGEYRDAHNEWALSYQTPQGLKQIIIDRSFIDKKGVRWIIDYKLAQTLTQEHCEQLSHYARIIAKLENREMSQVRCALYFPLKSNAECWKEIKLCQNTFN